MDQSQLPTSSQAGLPVPNQVPYDGVPQTAQSGDPMAVPLQSFAVPAITGANATPLQAGSHSPDSPQVAEDVDLIEKEWVEKAKTIVAKTRDDPNKQNHEINRFKADYLKTRYSKDIKVDES